MPDIMTTAHCPACTDPVGVNRLGKLVCRNAGCSRPTAAEEILSETELGHIIDIGDISWSMKHPLVERIRDELLKCDFIQYMKNTGGPPQPPGRYRVTETAGGSWNWERLPDDS
jgi:Family of unknown function (DUF6085)